MPSTAPTPRFGYAEHVYIDDTVMIPYREEKVQGSNFPGAEKQILGENFRVFSVRANNANPNRYYMTYGMVCAMAGDFFGTSAPISDGPTPQQRQLQFMDACRTMVNANGYLARNLAEYLDKERKIFDQFHRGELSELQFRDLLYNKFTLFYKSLHLELSGGPPNYLSLALVNFDHFGNDARTAYATGHSAAIEYAVREPKTVTSLVGAYYLNAFADHFLQDLFSAGHVRTPRRWFHKPGATINDSDQDMLSMVISCASKPS